MKLMKTTVIAGLAVTALAGAPASAQQLLTEFTPQNVTSILAGLGVTNIRETVINGSDGQTTKVVLFNTGDVVHNAGLEVCNTGAPGCLGLHLVTIWNLDGAVNVEAVNAFNGRSSFSKATAAGDQALVTRYVISDGGVSRKNIEENIKNHVALSLEFPGFYNNNAAAASVSFKPGKASAGAEKLRAPTGLEGVAMLMRANDVVKDKGNAMAAPAAWTAAEQPVHARRPQ